ncbi:MAG: hypothetical protein ABFS05_12705 [Bacteroidota bacterium]
MRVYLKLLFVFAIAGLFFSQTHAQKKCKFKYENEDPFTGEISRGTITTIFSPSLSTNEYWHIGINRENDKFNILNDIQLSGQLVTHMNIGDSLMFKTADGTIIKCYSLEEAGPRPKATKIMNRKILNTQYTSIYEVSIQQLEAFARSEITYVRMNIGDEVFEQKVKSKHARDFLNDARCIIR